jgi:hypothetical protein
MQHELETLDYGCGLAVYNKQSELLADVSAIPASEVNGKLRIRLADARLTSDQFGTATLEFKSGRIVSRYVERVGSFREGWQDMPEVGWTIEQLAEWTRGEHNCHSYQIFTGERWRAALYTGEVASFVES